MLSYSMPFELLKVLRRCQLSIWRSFLINQRTRKNTHISKLIEDFSKCQNQNKLDVFFNINFLQLINDMLISGWISGVITCII